MTEDERDTYLGGYVSLGFFAIGGIAALIVGYLADWLNRKWVFAATVCIGEISCAATFFVETGTIAQFWSGLWLTRAITGTALGGAIPIQFSYIGDLFPAADRGKAVAFFSIANGVGQTVGQFFAGYMTPEWRLPFLIVSLPTFILVGVFLATTEEPKRGQAEAVLQQKSDDILAVSHTITKQKIIDLFSRPSVICLIFQGLTGSLPWGVVQTFLNDYLSNEKDLEDEQAANVILVWAIMTAIATIVGGLVADRYWVKNKYILPFIAGITTFIAPFPLLIVIRANNKSEGFFTGILIPNGLIAGIAAPIVKTMLLQVTLPETRGTAFAVTNLMDSLGLGIGPYIVSAIINAADNRGQGLSIAIFGWIPTALIMMLTAVFLKGDLRRNDEILLKIYAHEGNADPLGDPEAVTAVDGKLDDDHNMEMNAKVSL